MPFFDNLVLYAETPTKGSLWVGTGLSTLRRRGQKPGVRMVARSGRKQLRVNLIAGIIDLCGHGLLGFSSFALRTILNQTIT